MSIRVHKLAKELEISSKDLVDKLKELGVEVKGHMSAIDLETAELVKAELSSVKEDITETKKETVKEVQLEKVGAEQTENNAESIEVKTEEDNKDIAADKKPEATQAAESLEKAENAIEVDFPITVKELCEKIDKKTSEVMSFLIKQGVFATINQNLDEETAFTIAMEFGVDIKKAKTLEEQFLAEEHENEDHSNLIGRSPVVTFMGHVDHGKTSLLDYIRKTKVTEKEKGGITQHIGAYTVSNEKGSVTFLDTPGHAAFTAMRARGANATDIVVLVVAADDGVMPQTREAIDHARAAGVPIVVAINKCDLPDIKLDKIKMQLNEIGLMPEDWGGKTIMLPVSAKTGQGIDNLVDMLVLEAELLELKANPHIKARGVVIEAKLCQGKGVTSTLLVKNGTLRVGDIILSGLYYGRIKAMIDHRGKRIMFAPPSTPVEILGLQGVPDAGDDFFIVKDEKKAKTLSELKQRQKKDNELHRKARITLENFHDHLETDGIKELKIILKADVQGSLEAIDKSLQMLNTKDVQVKIIHADVGNINENDIMLGVVSDAVVIGFHVKIAPKADETAKREAIEVKKYDIIYELINDVQAGMEGMLEPIEKEIPQGYAKIQQVFSVSKTGIIAGCIVTKGKISRSNFARLKRDGQEIFKGKIKSLKRFKDDARDVTDGMECGIALEGFSKYEEEDIIESFIIEKTARRLNSK